MQRLSASRNGRIVALAVVLVLAGIIFCGYGHAALSTDLLISGEATVAPPDLVFGVEYMQDLTSELCSQAAIYATDQLIDKRDNQTYWVTKMKDGHCWMTQDLRLRLTANVDLTSDLTNVESSWTPPYSTFTSISSSNLTKKNTEFYSYDLGEYIFLSASTTTCDRGQSSLSGCPSNAMKVGTRTPSSDPNFLEKYPDGYSDTEYDAHRLIGFFYPRITVSAGTFSNVKSPGNFIDSICPKGWRVPSGDSGDSTPYSYNNLRSKEHYDATTIVNAPYYFNKSGELMNTTSAMLRNVGGGISYATSTKNSSYAPAFNGAGMTGTLGPLVSGPVRCVLYGE